MADLLELSSRIIDSGVAEDPQNRVTQELSEVADGVAVIESFSHVISVATDDGLVAFDASGQGTGRAVVESLRGWSTAPVSHLVYTHGHADHVGGSPAFVADAAARGHPGPRVVAHENVPVRLDRYELTNDWNVLINQRQFGWIPRDRGIAVGGGRRFVPDDVARPDDTYADRHDLDVGGLRIELHHAKGETDDHTWSWIPDRKIACVGDLFIWNFPNAGNPQKVQRFPEDWAAALRTIAGHGPELMLPAHGLPIAGKERIARVLGEAATALEGIVRDVLAMMNAGASLDDIVHTVRVDDALLGLPYLRPLYDEPEFVVRNVWRRYGGWWDTDPSHLKPAPAAAVATELAMLAGGADRLATRAREIADADDLRLACHLIELAAQAAPEDPEVHAVRADIYERRRQRESSLMTKGIFAAAVRESREQAGMEPDPARHDTGDSGLRPGRS
ncbi:MAG: alkyl sulfatase dimerization domain-containing protein [Desertimonas sp.]